MAFRNCGFIFARSGSKGLPGKNLMPLAGKPLIGWAIEQSYATGLLDRVVVSTDCDDIASVARTFGAEIPFMRPAKLAQDDSPEWLAWQHAISCVEETYGEMLDYMVSVPATAPLRHPEDIARCIELFEKGKCDAVVTMTQAHRNPYFNMLSKSDQDYVDVVVKPERPFVRRQDAPEVFDMTTVAFVVGRQFVLDKDNIFDGQIKGIVVPKIRSLDIDTAEDFALAEFYLSSLGQNEF